MGLLLSIFFLKRRGVIECLERKRTTKLSPRLYKTGDLSTFSYLYEVVEIMGDFLDQKN